jgi:adenylosuccinate synthase
MPAIVCVGAQWGDEGKGKVVDLLAARADAVVRYAGGPNAGHTLVVGGERLVLRLVPSGVLHPHTRCVLGQGMVLDLGVVLEELEALARRGVELAGRLFVSERAHLIMPYHVEIDALREAGAGGTKIGTTRRGIGPCYEDKAGRRGVRVGDLRDLGRVRELVRAALAFWSPVARSLGGELATVERVCEPLERQAAVVLAHACDASALCEQWIERGDKVMLEGAQGTMLDLDHGTYPFVTSSTATAGGACTGAGIGPTRIDRVLGISKAYATRVGAGPFPTELDDATGKFLRDAGGEYGSVTGRPRRTGWLDLPALRYARRVNGLDGLVLTKLDVLSGLDEVQVCVAYDTPAGRVGELPVTTLATATPVYETLPGWKPSVGASRALSELPERARRYLELVERETGLPLYLVSVGAERDDAIALRDPFAC